jgi:hypothetical protein
MTEIILTSDQMHQLASATDDVVFADGRGNVIVRLSLKISDAEAAIIDDAKRRLSSRQPRVPFSDVVQRLQERTQQEETNRP